MTDMAHTAEVDIRRIKLEIFEGPLDLLLHLIQKNELDIATVSLSAITDQYLIYLNIMQELNIELAGEFLVIAAELTRLKSRALLPDMETELVSDEEGSLDQVALIERLLRYQQIKQAAQTLSGKLQLGIDLFRRAVPAVELKPADLSRVPIRSEDSQKLVFLYRALASRRNRAVIHQVALETVSVRQKMIELIDRLARLDREQSVRGLVSAAPSRRERVGVFLAILELLRMRMCKLMMVQNQGDTRYLNDWHIVRSDVNHAEDVLHAYQEEFRT